MDSFDCIEITEGVASIESLEKTNEIIEDKVSISFETSGLILKKLRAVAEKTIDEQDDLLLRRRGTRNCDLRATCSVRHYLYLPTGVQDQV